MKDQSVIRDIAVERVQFRCPQSHWQSVVDYDAVLYADPEGTTWRTPTPAQQLSN